MQFISDVNYNPEDYADRISSPISAAINKQHDEWLITKNRHDFGLLTSNTSLFMMVSSYFVYRTDVLQWESHGDDFELNRYSDTLDVMRRFSGLNDFTFIQNKAVAEVLIWRDLNGVSSGDRMLPAYDVTHQKDAALHQYHIYRISVQEWYDIFSTVVSQPETLPYFENGVTDIKQVEFYIQKGIDAEMVASLSTQNMLVAS